MANLTEHFTEYELSRTGAGDRAGLSNVMDARIVHLYVTLCVAILEPLRARVGRALHVSSGYRSPAVNKAAKGSKSSAHMALESDAAPEGEAAADIEAWGISNLELAVMVDSHQPPLDYDQAILEHHYADDDDPNSGWVHVSIRPGHNRRQRLTAYYHPKKRRTVYAPGFHLLRRGQVVENGKVVWPSA